MGTSSSYGTVDAALGVCATAGVLATFGEDRTVKGEECTAIGDDRTLTGDDRTVTVGEDSTTTSSLPIAALPDDTEMLSTFGVFGCAIAGAIRLITCVKVETTRDNQVERG